MRLIDRSTLIAATLLAVAAMQLPGCAGAPVQSGVRPGWVDSSSARESRWSRQQFVTAVGSGTTRIAAETAAKRAVAESLRMDVRSTLSRETKSQFSQDTSGRASGTDSESTGGQVDIVTDVQLQGVEIAENYFEAKENAYYSLAVLDRMKARSAAAGELAGIKSRVRSRLEGFLRRPDPEVGAEIRSLIAEFEKKNQLAAALGNGVPLPGPLTSGELAQMEAAEDAAIAGRTVTLDFGPEGRPLADAVGACLSSKRVVVQDGAPADSSRHVSVRGALTSTDQKIAVKGFVKVVYDFGASAESAAGGLGKIAVSMESTGRNPAQAFEKIRTDFGEQVCREVMRRLLAVK